MSVETSPDIQGHARLCGCAACRAGTTASAPEPQGSVITTLSGGGNISFLTAPNYVPAALLAGDEFRWNYNPPGTPLSLTYGFMTTMPWYATNSESGPFQSFLLTQQEGVHRAIENYESVCNVDFTFLPNGDAAQVRFGTATLDASSAAHAYYPDRGTNQDWEGDVWFNLTETYSGSNLQDQSGGSYGYFVTLHEIGHTLGLQHPHDADPLLPYGQDNRQYTVMSYNGHPGSPDIEPQSLLLYDIAALQYLYGANTSYKSGNDNWRWLANESFIWCLWDGGGDDTLDASNQTRRVVIDLNPGTFSSLGSYNGGDAVNNLAIAFDCWIENAKGGSGSDIITGNLLGNRLEGNGGSDTIDGGAGNDTLFGGAGDDELIGGDGADLLDGGAGFDAAAFRGRTATAADFDDDTFVSIEQARGGDGNDVLVAVSGITWLVGNNGADRLISGATADTLDGGYDFDRVSYERSSTGVTINLATGARSGAYAVGDVFFGIEGIEGSAFSDTLIGNAGNNHFYGGDGNDVLDGGVGADTAYGGRGDDVYYVDSRGDAVYENASEGFDEVRTTVSDSSMVSLPSNVEKLTFVGTGNFNAFGSYYNDIIAGGAGNDRLDGYLGDDTLDGGSGDDYFLGNIGADAMIGGAGVDTVDYHFASQVTVDLAAGTGLGSDAQGDTLSGIEAVIGSWNGSDTLLGSAAGETFTGQGGNDVIDGRGGYDTAVYSGQQRDYEVTTTTNGVTTIRALRSSLFYEDGVDQLSNIENIRFDGTEANHAPVVLRLGGNPARNSVYQLNGLIRAQDADQDAAQVYEIRETTPGAGWLTLNAVVQPVNQTISVSGADFDFLVYHAGSSFSDTDRFEVRVSDGVDWSSWATVTLTPVNSAPQIAVRDVRPTHNTTSVRAQDMIVNAWDTDNDPILRYRFEDATPGNGYFALDGARVATSVLEIPSGDLADVSFVAGTSQGTHDLLRISVFDGFAWSAPSGLWLYAPPNALPVVTANNLSPSHGSGFVLASSMVSVSDGDGDTITQYEFRDNTTGHGYFRLGGVQQATTFQIAANQLANLQFVPTAAPGGQDQLEVRAFDGYGWGAWKSFSVAAVPNAAPGVTASGQVLSRGTAATAASSLFSIADSDGDTMSRYRFFDGTSGNGRFALSGVPQAENINIEITSAQLAGMQFVLGAAGTSDVVWVQAFDGFTWSSWTSFTVTAPQNAAPAAVVSDRTPSPGTTSIAAATLVTPSDADGDTITQYRFFDGTIGNGYFLKSGAIQVEQTNISVTAAELAATQFVLGGGSDLIWVQVYDGMAWSAWKSFTVNPPRNNAPVVSINTGSLNPGRGTASVAASAFFTVSDAENHAITQYRFFDGTAGNGAFTRDGVPQTQLVNLDVAAADLATFRYQVSATGGGDTLWVQAFDGFTWSAWKSFNVAAPVNSAPVVSVSNLTPARGTTALAAASLFSVADADGDALTQYRFFDGTAGSGYFRKGATPQAELTNITVNAADLATTQFVQGGASDVLWVQAFDGVAWSAWQSFTVAPPANNAPVVTVSNLTPGRAVSSIAGASLFSASDADGDAVTQYRFFDGTLGNGRFLLDGSEQVEHQNITINAADLADFSYRTSTTGTGDTLWVQASDGTAWGAWKSFTVGAPQNNAPQVTVSDRQERANTAIAASTLFTVSDPDNDPVTRYQFWDSTSGGGAFNVSNTPQPWNATIEIMASQLAATTFVTGGAAGTDQLWARAFDGTSWGQWKTFNLTTLAST